MMATIFRTPTKRTDPQTGKRIPAFDAKGKALMHPNWRAVIVDYQGKRKTVTLSTDKREAQKQADLLEAREREIKAGLRPVPTPPDVNAARLFTDVAAEYMAWGRAQGGKKGMPWNHTHASMKERHLFLWRQTLSIELMGDVYDVLPKVEAECRAMRESGNTGKTVWHKAESLRSFFIWCKKRKYITENPLENLGKFDTSPKTIRRAMTIAELHSLLENCAPHRRLLYEVAACSGLRENELRQLTTKHLDTETCALRIDKEWDKGRKDRTQYIPTVLMERLIAFAASGEAQQLYAKALVQQGKRRTLKKTPTDALLYVPRNCCAMLKVDLKKAGVALMTDKGKLDFHALRTAYINFVLRSNVDPKTAQTMSRHATFDMTLNTYGREAEELCRAAAESVGRMVFGTNEAAGLSQATLGNYRTLTEQHFKDAIKKQCNHFN
jgi:integrase